MWCWMSWLRLVMGKESLNNKLLIWSADTIIQLWITKHYMTYEHGWPHVGTTRDANFKEETEHRWMRRCSGAMLGWAARSSASAAALELWLRWVVWQMAEYATTETTDAEKELRWDNSPNIMCSLPMVWYWDLNHIILTWLQQLDNRSNKLQHFATDTIILLWTERQHCNIWSGEKTIWDSSNQNFSIELDWIGSRESCTSSEVKLAMNNKLRFSLVSHIIRT